MQYQVISKLPNTSPKKVECLVTFTMHGKASKGQAAGVQVLSHDLAVRSLLKTLLHNKDYHGDEGEMLYLPYHDHKDLPIRILYVHASPKEHDDGGEWVRNLSQGLLPLLAMRHVESLVLDVMQIDSLLAFLKVDGERFVECFVEGLELGGYQFTPYKKKSSQASTSLKKFSVLTHPKSSQGLLKRLQRIGVVNAHTLLARNWINEPANRLGVKAFSSHLSKEAKKIGLKYRSLKKAEIQKERMGGILAVNAGSAEDAELMILEHVPKKKTAKTPTVLLVGKGVMFDSGGISLKPSLGMQDMKMDMSGAAVVAASVLAAARLKISCHLVGLIPATDNMPDAKATKPGNIITMYNGLNVEVDNTDAEGRLILADALAYGIKHYSPHIAIDLATLTGACVVALGHHTAGLFANRAAHHHKTLLPLLFKAGDDSYEKVCSFPMDARYGEQLKSDMADLKNIGGSDAGAITAAKFLERFVHDKTAWVHLDIAGTSMLKAPISYRPKAGSGFGVRLLMEFLRLLEGR